MIMKLSLFLALALPLGSSGFTAPAAAFMTTTATNKFSTTGSTSTSLAAQSIPQQIATFAASVAFLTASTTTVQPANAASNYADFSMPTYEKALNAAVNSSELSGGAGRIASQAEIVEAAQKAVVELRSVECMILLMHLNLFVCYSIISNCFF
jgi:hypothetical protein